MLPGADTMRSKSATATGATKTFLLGATSGIAGVCSGPILGAVLTLAATRGSVFLGGVMLAIYGAGMVVPLFIIAALWSRMGPRARSVMRGGSVNFFGRRLPVVSMVTGALMIVIGIVFRMTNGLVSAPSLISTSTLAHIQEWAGSWTSTTLDILVVCLLAVIAIALWLRHERRRNRDRQDREEGQEPTETATGTAAVTGSETAKAPRQVRDEPRP